MFIWKKYPLFALLALLSLVYAQGPTDDEPFQLPSVEELAGNVSTQIITVPENPGPLYSGEVDIYKELIAKIPTNVKSLSKAVCIPEIKSQTCSCIIAENLADSNLAQFKCTFFPPVRGTYKLNIESEKSKAYGNFSIEMIAGQLPILKQEVKQETISPGLLLFAISFAAIAVFAYLLYFAYKFYNRKRDALQALYEQRQKIEDDMKVLRYRFFKREIDANTYNAVFKQKEIDLASVNRQIIGKLKPKNEKDKKAPVPPN